MKEGLVVEKGNHEELMAMKGHYCEMVALQERHDIDGTEGKKIYDSLYGDIILISDCLSICLLS